MREYSLERYGEPVSCYEGKAQLQVAGQVMSWEFQAAQYPTGLIRIVCEVAQASIEGVYGSLLGCEEVISFVGDTTDGAHIVASSVRVLSRSSQLTEERARTVYVLTTDRLIVEGRRDTVAVRAFGLVNLLFTGTTPDPAAGVLLLDATVPIDNEGNCTRVVIAPIHDYEERARYLRAVKGYEVTAELRVEPQLPIETCARIADSICLTMSVCRGTKVQWIYMHEYDANGSILRSEHFDRVTKPYSGLAAISHGPEMREPTRRLLEVGTRALMELHADIPGVDAAIESYIDAKGESDYIELRAAKLAVALEALRCVLSRSPQWDIREFIMDSELFKSRALPQLQREVEKVLRDLAVSKQDRESIANKVLWMNSRSFSRQLEDLFRKLRLDINGKDIRLFVACRNKLIHAGAFYCGCATAAEKRALSPLDGPVREFLFMLHVLDQVFLKLLNYSGPYIDWHDPQGPQQKALV